MSELTLSSQQLQQVLSQLAKGQAVSASSNLNNSPVLAASTVVVTAVSKQQLQLLQGQQRISLPISSISPAPQIGQQYQLTLPTDGSSRILLTPQAPVPNKIAPALQSTLFEIIDKHLFKSSQAVLPAKVLQSTESQLTLSFQGQRLTLPLRAPIPEIKIGQTVQLRISGNHVQLLLGSGETARQWPATTVPSTTPGISGAAPGISSPASAILFTLLNNTGQLQLSDTLTNAVQVALAKTPQHKGITNGIPITLSAEGKQLAVAPKLQTKSATIEVTLASQLSSAAVTKPEPSITANQLKTAPLQAKPLETAIAHPAKQDVVISAGTKDKASVPVQNTSNSQTPPLNIKGEAITPASLKSPPQITTAVNQSSLVKQWNDLPEPVRQGLQNAVASLQRTHLSQSDPPSALLKQLVQNLNELPPDTKALIQKLVNRIEQSFAQGHIQDVEPLRQLLTAPPLPLTNTSALQNTPAGGMLGALVNLLQVVLASRLSRQQPALQSRIADTLAPLLTALPTGAQSQRSRKPLQDLAQWDQKHQIARLVGKLLSSHSQAKLNNIEQLSQQQSEQFYYPLPLFQGVNQQAELLLKRRWPDASKNKQKSNSLSQWQLTMTLPVGDDERIMAKAHFEQDALKLDFYAMSAEMKDKVLNFLPWLQKRLEVAGIEMASTSCQMGKIPQSLANKPYQILQTQV